MVAGKSYYLGEGEAILIIIKASTEVLNYLNEHNSLVAVATHDLELIKLVSCYQNYYFREHVEGNKLSFDYWIKEGISPTRNAVRILKMIGYPDDIIDKIEENIS